MADQGGFTAAGEAHDAENFPFTDAEISVGNSDDAVILLADFCFAQPLINGGVQCLCCPFAEDFPDIAALNGHLWLVGYCTCHYVLAPCYCCFRVLAEGSPPTEE